MLWSQRVVHSPTPRRGNVLSLGAMSYAFCNPKRTPPGSHVQRIIPVSPTDTPKQLAAKVLKEASDGLREGRERGRERVRRRVKRGVGQSITGETRTEGWMGFIPRSSSLVAWQVSNDNCTQRTCCTAATYNVPPRGHCCANQWMCHMNPPYNLAPPPSSGAPWIPRGRRRTVNITKHYAPSFTLLPIPRHPPPLRGAPGLT